MVDNEYSAMIAEDNAAAEAPQASPVQPKVPGNEYSEMLAQDKQGEVNAIKGAFYVAKDKNPDEHAKNLAIAQKYGLPVEAVESGKDQIKKLEEPGDDEYKTMIEKSPKLAEWIKDPNKLALVHDDIPAMQKIEKVVNDHSFFEDLTKAGLSGYNNLISNVFKVPAYVYDAFAIPQNLIAKSMGRPQVRSPEWLKNNFITDHYEETSKAFSDGIPELSKSVSTEIGAGNYKDAAKALVMQTMQNAPTQVALMASYLSGYGTAGLVGAGLTTAAETNIQGEKAGADPLQSTLNATYHGAFESMFESIGTFGIMKSWEKAIADNFGKKVSAEVFKDVGKMLVYSAAGEANEEFLTSIAQDFSSYITGVNPDAMKGAGTRALDAGILGGFSGVAMSSPGGAVAGIQSRQYYKQTEGIRNTYLALGEAIDETKIKDRLSAEGKMYVESVTKDGPIENIHLDPGVVEEYFQSKGLNTVAEMNKIGILKEYSEAVNAGTDMKIPTAKWAAGTMEREHYNAFANDVKFGPEQLSVNELKAQQEEMKKAQAETSQEAAPELTQAQASEQQAKEIRASIKDQLVERGTDSKEAEVQSIVISEMFRVNADRTGQSPVDVMKSYGFTINDKNSPAQAEPIMEAAQSDTKTLFQAAPKKPQFYSKLQQTLDQKMGGSSSPTEIKGMLKEVKPEEMKWSGLDEFLKGKEKVTKAEVSEFLRGNQIEIKEVTKDATKGLNPEQKARLAELQDKADNDPDGELSDPEFEEYKTLSEIRDGIKGDSTKFSKYALPGGENYREILFTLPPKSPAELPDGFKVVENPAKKAAAKNGSQWIVEGPQSVNGIDQRYASGKTKEEAIQNYFKNHDQKDTYKSSHWDEKNVLAHTRLTDRIDSEGKKVLHVEEVQSDWHQDGRKKGYKSDLEIKPLSAEEKSRLDELKQLNNKGHLETAEQNVEFTNLMAREAGVGPTGAVPDAPFRKTWHEFVMKKIVMMAVEKGYDKVTWSTGEQSADHYDLAKQVDDVHASELMNGDFEISVFKNSRNLETRKVKPSELETMLGKDLAEKIKAKTGTDTGEGALSYQGNDLKVGGEGMKGFYDKIIPDFMRKFGKKFGATVGETTLSGGKEIDYKANKITDLVRAALGKNDNLGFDNPGQAAKAILDNGDWADRWDVRDKDDIQTIDVWRKSALDSTNTKVHSMDITPEMKQSIFDKGLELFQDGKLGSITIGKDNRISINLFKDANVSTLLHEMGHFYLEMIGDMVDKGVANEQMNLDYKTILEFVGVEKRSDIKTEHHEKIARAFEQYLREGKSPNRKLRQVFARLKVWLTNIYKNALDLNVEINDDIRKVFDRALSSEQEIAAAYGHKEIKEMIQTPETLGLSDDEFNKYKSAVDEAKLAAKEQMSARFMKEVTAERMAVFRAEKEAATERITKAVSELPVYRALSILQTGRLPDGTPSEVKIFKKDLVDAHGKDFVQALPKPNIYTTHESGLHPDVAAEMLGFKSGDALVQEISDAKNKSDLINELVDAEMKQKFPDPVDRPLGEDTLKALHNESRADLLHMELEYLAKKAMPLLKGVIKKVASRVPSKKIVREQALKIVDGIAVRDLKPHIYQRAEIKYANLAAKQLVSGDIMAAFESKKKELLNHEIFRAITEAQDEVENRLERFKKLKKKDEDIGKTRDVDLVNAARAILSAYGIGKADKTPYEYVALIEKYDPEQYANIENQIMEALVGSGQYKEVSFEKFSEMANTVQALWDLAKSNREIELDGVKMDVDQKRIELVSMIDDKLNKGAEVQEYKREATHWERTKRNLIGAKAALRRVESWSRVMDSGKAVGAFAKSIFLPVSAASTNYRLARTDVLKKLLDIMKPLANDINKKVSIKSPEIGFEFTSKSQLIGALLHTGNESNMRKLLLGRNWGSLNADNTVDASKWNSFIKRMQSEGILTKQDYDVVQQIWDLNEELKPLAQRAHKQMYGHYFNEITANTFETPWGEYRGGYVPANADPFYTTSAQAHLDKDTILKNDNTFMYPTTGRGFTKSRVEYNVPLSIDVRMIPQHVDKSLRFIHIEPTVKAVARLVMHKDFMNKMDELDPTAVREMLIPWLQRAAQQKVEISGTGSAVSGLNNVARILKGRTGLNTMVLNWVNTFQQVLGYSLLAVRVPPRKVLAGLYTYMTSPKQTAADVMEKSDYMKTALDSGAHEIRKSIEEIIVAPTTSDTVRDFATKHGYAVQQMIQNVINVSGWTAAYDQAIENGMSEADAVRDADAIIRATQGSFNAEDVSRIETGQAWQNLFKMFYSYFNMNANLLGTEFTLAKEMGLKKGAGRAFYIYLMGFMIPAILSEVISKGLSGKFDDDDDGEYLDDFFKLFFFSQGKTLAAMVPVAGQMANAVGARFNDNMYDDKITVSPVISQLEGAASAPFSIVQGFKDPSQRKKAAKDTLTLLGLLTGVPFGALGRPIGYQMDVNAGKTQPKNGLDYARGLLSGRNSDRRN